MSFSQLRCVCLLQTACCLAFAVSDATAAQDSGNATQPRRSRTSAVNSDRAAEDSVVQATALLDTSIRLGTGENVGFVNDFVVDNAGRVLFVLAGLEGNTVAVPFQVMSFAELPQGFLTLDLPASELATAPRLITVDQLSELAFQNQLIAYFRKQGLLDKFSPIRLGPTEIRRGSTLLGAEVLTQDQLVFGLVQDFIINRDGLVPFVTTSFRGDIVPMPFAILSLNDLATGAVSVDLPMSVLVEAPRISDVSSIDPSLQNQVNDFFKESGTRARTTADKGTRARSTKEAASRDSRSDASGARGRDTRRDREKSSEDRARNFATQQALRSRDNQSRADKAPSQNRQEPMAASQEPGTGKNRQGTADAQGQGRGGDTNSRDRIDDSRRGGDRGRQTGERRERDRTAPGATQPGSERANDRARTGTADGAREPSAKGSGEARPGEQRRGGGDRTGNKSTTPQATPAGESTGDAEGANKTGTPEAKPGPQSPSGTDSGSKTASPKRP